MLEATGRVEVVAEVADGLTAIAAIKRERPDLALLDLAMPHSNGIEVFAEARRWSPETRFVVFTGTATPGALAAMVGSGVHGVFLKTGDPAELTGALPRIMAGQQVIGRRAAEIVATMKAAVALSARELQVIQAVARGATNAEIAAALGISAKTVDNHRTNLMRKLGVHSTAELVMAGVRLGILDASSAASEPDPQEDA